MQLKNCILLTSGNTTLTVFLASVHVYCFFFGDEHMDGWKDGPIQPSPTQKIGNTNTCMDGKMNRQTISFLKEVVLTIEICKRANFDL